MFSSRGLQPFAFFFLKGMHDFNAEPFSKMYKLTCSYYEHPLKTTENFVPVCCDISISFSEYSDHKLHFDLQ